MCGVKQVLVRHRVRFSVWFWTEETYLALVQSTLECQATVCGIKHCWSFLEPFLFLISSHLLGLDQEEPFAVSFGHLLPVSISASAGHRTIVRRGQSKVDFSSENTRLFMMF